VSNGVSPQIQAQPAPASYQIQAAPSAPQAYQQQAAPQQVNPWQEAFNRLNESLSANRSYQSQAPSSPTIQQPAYTQEQAAYPYQAATQAYQAAPSYSGLLTSAFPQTQAYSPAAYSTAQAPMSAQPQQAAQASDGYLEGVSNESLEVLQHFGAEAPALLNRYSCVVEDALLNQARQTAEIVQIAEALRGQMEQARTIITAAAEDNAAYHTMLTNPGLLSDYVNDFFGANGPYPVETSKDRLVADIQAQEQRTFAPAPAPYSRPQLDMPSPGVQASAEDGSFWAVFSNLSERNPEAAWQMLSQATPDALRSKVLVSEG
jgi:hypothetical protein